uniref:Tyrosine-protein kinase n=1 Tax=Haemonchus contortus TaxID=6289 RepID=A0A7I4YG81_HAECO|nr:SH2 motif and Tyrosine protein kinase domain containing protein [Haemonchus contortus]
MPKAPDIAPQAEAFDVSLIKYDYFHGLLPREDVAVLLTRHGDFLLRLSEADTMGAKMEMVLSVMHDPKSRCRSNEPAARMNYIMHIIIQSAKKRYYIVCYRTFNSVPNLVLFYLKHVLIFRSQIVQLANGIGLAPWEFRAENLQLEQLIRKFSCGEVVKGKVIRKDMAPVEVAVKTVAGRSQEAREKILELMAQCRMLNDLYHPCVVQFFGVCLIAQPSCFVFEFVPQGPLDEWLRANKGLKRDELLLMIVSAGWGLEYLHQNSILHTDLAAKNCLYDGQFVKLSGFGKARKASTYTMKAARKMSNRWMAPESVLAFRFTQKSDVYGYGVLIYEIFAVKEPYEGLSNIDARTLILENDTPDFPGVALKTLTEFVREKMWALDPDKRSDMRQIMIWMQGYTGMGLQIVGGETCVTATVHQKVDNLLSKDVELQSLPNFKEPGLKTSTKLKKKKN